ncbi:metallo-beta-lactamase family protein [Striga hermonthica]|uniref:Metallo-beta-lactamase family protein n=1 Tax=Striga hermonthica TaxID=68872 RepID=A0A9N7R7C2_STRHE|nr:metallo-beta-lactamase family protein [Striga hermonthica]
MAVRVTGLTPSFFRIKASSEAYSKSNRLRRPQNVDGNFFVDHTCIDCDTCRWMAPEIFNRRDGMSAVFKQPTSDKEQTQALQALLSCPTNSIHTERPPRDISEVHNTFPIAIDEQKVQGVYHCGYHSEKSYGATSYFITRPQGNVLIDSPRYTKRLANSIKKMGGASVMFLTHRDDVADHDKWSKELGCARILHVNEVSHSTADVEIKLEGSGPWPIGSDITLIHTPGHTEGSVCLFDKTRKVLFTGDHLLMDEFGLSISENYNWYSVSVQLNSVLKLLELDFEWILPGHGRRASFRDSTEKNEALRALLAAKGLQA